MLRVRQAWTPGGGCLSPVDNSQWGRSCAAVTPPASPGRVRAAVHAPRERSPSSPSPSNKEDNQALEFCKECPQNVRTRSPHDTGHCMIQATVSTQSVGPSVRRSVGPSVGRSVRRMGKTAPSAPERRATATTVEILYRILTLFLRTAFSNFPPIQNLQIIQKNF